MNNINDRATIYLTEYGEQILDNYRLKKERETHIDLKSILSYDKSGKFSSELWNVMSIFGEHFFNGAKQIFQDNEINIEHRY